MKRLVILILTVFTIGAVTVCGCDGTKSHKNNIKIDTENVQIDTIEEKPDPEESDNTEQDEKCPDGECPHTRRPHKRHDKRLPRPKPTHRKDN